MAFSVEQPAARDDLEEIELALLLEGVFRKSSARSRSAGKASILP